MKKCVFRGVNPTLCRPGPLVSPMDLPPQDAMWQRKVYIVWDSGKCTHPRRVCYWVGDRSNIYMLTDLFFVIFFWWTFEGFVLEKLSECENKKMCHTGMTCKCRRVFFFQITIAAGGHQKDVVSPIGFLGERPHPFARSDLYEDI